MKKLFLFISFLMGSLWLFADPWGANSLYPVQGPNGRTDANVQPGASFLLRGILGGKPVGVDLRLYPEDEKKREKIEKMLANGFAEWFQKPAEMIRKSRREAEFADILRILDKGIEVDFSGESGDHIQINLISFDELPFFCGVGAVGCFSYGDGQPRIYIPKDKFLLRLLSLGKISDERTAVHEIGHALGLSDQYKQARDSNTHSVYRSSKPGKSVMNQAGSLTCDDVDGIINLIDITLGKSRGGELGWRSFCKDSSDYYVHGQTVGQGPYHIFLDSESELWRLDTYRAGKLERRVSFDLNLSQGISPLDALPIQVLERDAAQRPVFGRTSTGEDVYYSYVYDKKSRLIVRGGEAVLVEFWSPKWEIIGKSYQKFNVYQSFFGTEGKLTGVFARFSPKKGGTLEYKEGKILRNPARAVVFSFDKKKDLLSEEWSGSDLSTLGGDPYSFSSTSSSFRQQPSVASAADGLVGRRIKQEVTHKEKERSEKVLRAKLLKWFDSFGE